MQPCMICGQLTEGSVGAAGIRWPNLCQPCKDEEDRLVLVQVGQIKVIADTLFGLDKEETRRLTSPSVDDSEYDY